MVVCASGFASGLSVNSAAGAVYWINSLTYTDRLRQEFKQAGQITIKDLKSGREMKLG